MYNISAENRELCSILHENNLGYETGNFMKQEKQEIFYETGKTGNFFLFRNLDHFHVKLNTVPCFRRIYCTFFAFLVFNACYIHISHGIFGMFLWTIYADFYVVFYLLVSIRWYGVDVGWFWKTVLSVCQFIDIAQLMMTFNVETSWSIWSIW